MSPLADQRIGDPNPRMCLEHLCITNEAYLPAISAALKERPDEPVEQIVPGWFGGWFIRTFIEPSPQGKRAPAPAKIRPTAHVGLSVLDRFLSSNHVCRTLIADARNKDVNHIRFWNPLVKGIRFTVGTGLEIIAGHERRHLLQAERVRNSTNFIEGSATTQLNTGRYGRSGQCHARRRRARQADADSEPAIVVDTSELIDGA
jgi:hypothetical protein